MLSQNYHNPEIQLTCRAQASERVENPLTLERKHNFFEQTILVTRVPVHAALFYGTKPQGKMNRLLAYRFVVLMLLGLSKGNGQENDECPDPLFPMDTYCENIETWDDFVLLIDESVRGDELFICPFDVDKSAMPKVNITWDISVVCVLKDETDSCTFRGSGGFVNIASDGNTLFQGFHFRDSDDYAVDIASTAGNSSLATSTFCHCTFSGISRNQTTRGGAFIAQASAGVVSLLSCVFRENFSSNRGAAVYTRTSHMNIVDCQFIDNESIDWVSTQSVVNIKSTRSINSDAICPYWTGSCNLRCAQYKVCVGELNIVNHFRNVLSSNHYRLFSFPPVFTLNSRPLFETLD